MAVVTEDFEDTSYAAVFVFYDTLSKLSISAAQHMVGANSMELDLNGCTSEADFEWPCIANNAIASFWYRTGTFTGYAHGEIFAACHNGSSY